MVTSTGAAVYTTEGYYCSDATGALKAVTVSGKNNPWSMSATSSQIPDINSIDCMGVNGNNSNTPGDYLAVTVTYTYTPLFKGVSAVAMLGSTVTQTSWIRVG